MTTPLNLFWKITAYYAVCAAIVIVLYFAAPWVAEYLPVGHGNQLFATPSGPTLQAPQAEGPLFGDKLAGSSVAPRLVFLAMSFACSILVMLPVAFIYLGTHSGGRIDPFIVRTIIILPIAVTGLVLIVQNSLALAFSLAGIVAGAGIRFRMRIREMTDTVYFLVSIGVGLASGVGSLGLAFLMSCIFCYAAFTVHTLQVGGDPREMKGKKKDKEKGGDKEKVKEPEDDDDD